ncbi:MAG: peptidoglycan-binding domain-containing protein [Spirulinaceae cyanobacterium]
MRSYSTPTFPESLVFHNGPVTGYFGSLTEKSVVQFQQAMGLVVDGVVGLQTRRALATE